MAAIAMSLFLATIDGSIVNVALPTLVRELQTDFATVQWVVLGYLLVQTTLMLSMGRLGDMIGKKPIYTAGVVIFTLGSLLCGLAPTVYWLIGFRLIQAIGASMTLSLGTAIVTEAFPPTERGRALGLAGTMISAGVVFGPTIGGVLIEALSWHWIFFVNLPVGIIGTILAVRYVPDFRPTGRQQFDYWGALTLLVTLLALSLALTVGQQLGFTDGRILALFATFALFLTIFLLIEWRTPQPMIDLKLFRNRLFSINLLSGTLVFVGLSGVFILLPFYLELVLGFDPRRVGLLMAVVPILLSVTAPISGWFSDKFGPRPVIVVGLSVVIFGAFLLSRLNEDTTVILFILSALPIGAGIGIFQSPNNSAVMGSVPRERLGIASSLLSVTRTLGQVTGIAILGAVWAARTMYHYGSFLPAGATSAPAAAQVAGLHDTFLLVMALVGVALFFSIWGLIRERRGLN
ncbi:MAG: MFS transporter [Ardenticatenaceae bacterium]|nr:MFS transporter [Ardenticatenaceae bacterium]